MTLVVFAVVVPVSIMTFRQPPVFEVSASVIIKPEVDKSMPRQGDPSPFDPCIGSTAIALEILNGNILSEQVIKSIGATRLFFDSSQKMPSLLRQFKQQLSIFPVSGTRIIRIAFQHQKPEVAVNTVEVLIRLFREQYRNIQEPLISLLDKQLLLHRKEMEQAEKKLFMYRKKNRTQPFVEYKQSLVLEQEELKSLLFVERKKMKELSAALEILRRHYLTTPELSGAGSANNALEDRTALLDLKLYEYELLRKYEKKEPLIASVRQQIRRVMERLQGGSEQKMKKLEAVANQIVHATVEESGQREKEAAIRLRLRQLENKRRLLAEQKGLLKDLRSEVEKARERYALQRDKIEESMTTVRRYVTVVEKPVIPNEPVKPKQLRNISLAAVFGLSCSLLYIFLSRHLWKE